MDCKRCGALLNQGVVLCPECGTRQRRRVSSVRCARCHKTVSLGLTVCPHCGRDVRPAGPRWGWLAVGFVAIILVSLWGLDKLPIAQAIREVQAVRQRISGLVEVLGPVVVPSPIPTEPAATPALLALVTETPVATEISAETPPDHSPVAMATDEVIEPVEPPVAAEESASPTPAAEAAVGPTEAPAATLTLVPVATPTAPPTPSPTATLPPPTGTPTPTRPAATGTTTYRVQSGDTLSSIAARFGITWEALAAANGLTGNSVLRIGQELIVPGTGAPSPPTATATARPRATATLAASPTPLPQLAAPVLVGPGDQSSPEGGNALIVLQWEPVAGMGPDDQYQVVVQWTTQGIPQSWSEGFTTQTEIRVPLWLWLQADQPARKYTWYVQAVRLTTDGRGGRLVIPLSPPSQSRVFYWR